MRERAIIHVGGPKGSGKTTFVEAILAAGDGPILAARCVRDDALRHPRESSPRTHAELRRYLAAVAHGAAVFAFPGQAADPMAFYETELMLDYADLQSSTGHLAFRAEMAIRPARVVQAL